jgi:hypothetical protein
MHFTKKTVSEIIDSVFRFCGQKTTVIFCDNLKDLGFKHAFKAGISFGKDDLVIPDLRQAASVLLSDPDPVGNMAAPPPGLMQPRRRQANGPFVFAMFAMWSTISFHG